MWREHLDVSRPFSGRLLNRRCVIEAKASGARTSERAWRRSGEACGEVPGAQRSLSSSALRRVSNGHEGARPIFSPRDRRPVVLPSGGLFSLRQSREISSLRALSEGERGPASLNLGDRGTLPFIRSLGPLAPANEVVGKFQIRLPSSDLGETRTGWAVPQGFLPG
jgi:hypothetical protein